MTVALHPADLGAVQVHATLHDGVLNVTVACADEASRHAVTAALPDLHAQLGGSARIDVQIGSGAQSQAGSGGRTPDESPVLDRGGNAANGSAGDGSAPPPVQPTTPVGSRGDGGLDRWM